MDESGKGRKSIGKSDGGDKEYEYYDEEDEGEDDDEENESPEPAKNTKARKQWKCNKIW